MRCYSSLFPFGNRDTYDIHPQFYIEGCRPLASLANGFVPLATSERSGADLAPTLAAACVRRGVHQTLRRFGSPQLTNQAPTPPDAAMMIAADSPIDSPVMTPPRTPERCDLGSLVW